MVLWLQRITLEVPVSQSMFLMSASSLPINDNGTSKKQSKSHQWPKALSKSLQVANGFREVHGLPRQGVPSCGTSTFRRFARTTSLETSFRDKNLVAQVPSYGTSAF